MVRAAKGQQPAADRVSRDPLESGPDRPIPEIVHARLTAIIALAATHAACAHSSLGIGYDATSKGQGVLAPVMNDNRATGSVTYGVGTGAVKVQVVLNGHHLDLSPTGDRFAAGSVALELRARVLHFNRFALIAHGGPSRGMVFDKEMLSITWGIGYRAGTGIEVDLGPISLWADAHREDLVFGGEVVNGWGIVQGVTVGVTIGQ